VLIGHEGERLRPGRALFWSLTWGVGVAVGVAAGGWLTLVGGAGAPGSEALQPLSDLVALPALGGGIVMLLHLVGQFTAAALRGRAVARAEDQG